MKYRGPNNNARMWCGNARGMATANPSRQVQQSMQRLFPSFWSPDIVGDCQKRTDDPHPPYVSPSSPSTITCCFPDRPVGLIESCHPLPGPHLPIGSKMPSMWNTNDISRMSGLKYCAIWIKSENDPLTPPSIQSTLN